MYTSLQEQADIASKTKLSRNAISKEESAEIAKEKVKDDWIYWALILEMLITKNDTRNWKELIYTERGWPE